ncbi:MAG TPA: ATP-binding protein [Ilumatobacteraceae bacterium]|nr:ATP-binding protein [Ilumatobacteraceae bacterium]
MTDVAPAGVHTLQRVLVVARWLCWGWMVGVVAFGHDALVHPVVAWSAVGVMLAVAILATHLARADPDSLRRPLFVATETFVVLLLAMADGWVFKPGHVFTTSQNLATEWPLIVATSAGIAAGPIVAGAIGFLFGPARLLSAAFNDFSHFGRKHLVASLATALFYAACGALIGWLVTLLRRSEDAISHHRARDEMARVLHDTVLQTLALVDRRARDSDPELAATARQADRDLRAFLFADGSSDRESLRARIHNQIDRVRAGSETNIVVNVLDDDSRIDGRTQDALARAIGEAVANAIEHARCSKIVVFAESLDAKQILATIRDDGVGFDAATSATGHGISHSIVARMEAVGGHASITSSPGHGTEVSLWTRNPTQPDPTQPDQIQSE